MFRRVLGATQIRAASQWVRYSSSQVAEQPKEKWDLLAGVLVERLPVISRDLTKFEQEYAVSVDSRGDVHRGHAHNIVYTFQKMLADIEFENSMKSDHEVRHERDLLMAEKLKKGDVELDLDESVKQTAQDMKDAYTEELKKFEFASRITDADRKGDTKSLDRKLDQALILLVEQQIGSRKHLLLPQGLRNEGETLRDTAERVLKEKCGESLVAQVYGNSPVGFYKYKYPSEQRKTAVGAKVFFYRAVLKNQPLTPLPLSFEWLTKSEVAEKLPVDYLKSVQQFVL